MGSHRWIGVALRIGSVVAGVGCSAPPGDPAGDEAWVDPLGTDDDQHGGAPGASAFRTITFALAHATDTIHLDAGTYDMGGGETFPLVLTGQQVLLGNPGLVAHIAGNGPRGSSATYATLVIAGAANRIEGIDITTTDANRAMFPECVRFENAGPHLIVSDHLHGCSVVFDGPSGVTVRDVTTGDTTLSTAENCLQAVGDDVRVERFACHAANDWVFGCGANFTGCETVAIGRTAACATNVAGFAAACP